MRTGPIDFDTRATRCDPLYVLPVGLVAVELGWRWGLGAAALAFALYVAWSLLADVDLSALGYATRALVLFALGGVLGQLAARARATGEESERCFPWRPTCSPPRASKGASRT